MSIMTDVKFNLILQFIFFHIKICLSNPYCLLPCQTQETVFIHTVCELAPCSLGHSCEDYAEMIPLYDHERQLILNIHNKFRSTITNGNSFGNAVSNMLIMTYDMELEFIAQCFANSCPYDRDRCRRKANMSVNQNIYKGHKDDRTGNTEFIKTALHTWQSGIKHVSNSTIYKYVDNKLYSAFTQIVWANTMLVGCGRTKTGGFSMVLICNYAPAGNVHGASVFNLGKQCTECDSKQCKDGLCGESKILRSFVPPFVLGNYSNVLTSAKLIIITCLFANVLYLRNWEFILFII